MVGAPVPAVATKAVGSPPTPQVTLKPSFWSTSASAWADFFSCSAISGVSQNLPGHRGPPVAGLVQVRVGRPLLGDGERGHDQRHHEGKSATVHGHTSGHREASRARPAAQPSRIA